jgi:hypothetical protein
VISCAVLQIAYRIKIRYHANSISISDNQFILTENDKIEYLVKKRPHQLQKPVQPINLEKKRMVMIQKNN